MIVKFFKVIFVILAIGFVGIQFMRPDRTNPMVNEAETLEATTEVPKDVQAILKRSCYDCHSNKTVYPWYSNIAPVSWQVVDHIRVGREELNFSKWATYSKDRKERKLEEICEEVVAREMPYYQYLWVHWDAVLSEKDIKALCYWTKIETEKIKEQIKNN